MSSGGREGWYKEGARWGHGGDHKEQGSHTLRYLVYLLSNFITWMVFHRSENSSSCRKVKVEQKEVSAAGETPDLVRDCNKVALVEEISSE